MLKKEISSVQNWKEAFWETALCSLNSSHRVTCFPSRSFSLRLFLWNWQRDIWEPIEGYGEKGKSSLKNWKEAFWETALFSVNSSHSYCFPLKKPFAKTVLVEFAKWYLEAHSGLWGKRIYLLLKTEKKVSEELLCDMWLPLTELQLFFEELFASLISV